MVYIFFVLAIYLVFGIYIAVAATLLLIAFFWAKKKFELRIAELWKSKLSIQEKKTEYYRETAEDTEKELLAYKRGLGLNVWDRRIAEAQLWERAAQDDEDAKYILSELFSDAFDDYRGGDPLDSSESSSKRLRTP